MDDALKSLISKDGLLKIHAVNRDCARHDAINSMIMWGLVNIGAWFFFGRDFRETLGSLNNPSGGIYFLMYGALGLGVLLLAFAFIGFTQRMMTAIILNGLSLITVGLWNISNDFIAIGALKPYGYTIEKPGTFWIILGIIQIGWGINQLTHGVKLKNLSHEKVTRPEMDELRKQLRFFVHSDEKEEKGLVKGTISDRSGLLDIAPRITSFTGRLTDDSALFVSSNLDDSFVIEREKAGRAVFSKTGDMTVEVDGKRKTMTFTKTSLPLIKQWCGQALTADEIKAEAIAKMPDPRDAIQPKCKNCGNRYDPADFREDAKVWLCPACKEPLLREA